MRIGVFMGSFDPIHIGHISVIMEVINKNLVDSIMIVPTKHNPWKGVASASFEDRYKMCCEVATDINELCIGGKYHGLVYVSSIENDMNEPVYSADVLRDIKSIYPDGDELFVLCGTDVAGQIKDWHDGDWIIQNCGIIEVGRVGEIGVDAEQGIKISSTLLRDMLRNGLNPYPYISKSVYSYIKANKLYNFIEQ